MHGKKKRKITGESAAEGVRYSRGTKLRAARPLFSFVRDRNMHARIALIIACPLDSNRLIIFFIIKLVSLSLSIFLASNTTAIESGALRMRNYSFEPSKARKKIIPYISRQSVLHSLSFVRSSRPFSPLPRFVISARNSRYEQKDRHSFQSDERLYLDNALEYFFGRPFTFAPFDLFLVD